MTEKKTTRSKPLKVVDEYEQKVITNAVYYNVSFFQPGFGTKVHQSFEDLKIAKAYCKVTLQEPNRLRSALIYAIDSNENHALVGTMSRDLVWKEVIPQTL
jgi:hypothetical protein